MVTQEWQSHAWNLSITCPLVACVKDPRMSVYALILCPEISVQVAVESDTRMLVVQLCTLVTAVAKVEYFLINMCVRIDVFQGLNLTAG